jgi:TatA/E family protein of Tat protein translocase
MFDISAVQILIVLVIALLVFGPKRLPELGRQVGRGIRELKGHMNAVSEGITNIEPDPPERAGATPPPAAAAAVDDDDLLDGVVVSGSTPPPPRTDG